MSKKQKLYYKCAQCKNDDPLGVKRIYSAIQNQTENPVRVEYFINQWVEATVKGSGIFVFDNLDDASDFARYTRCDLYSCEVEGIIKNHAFVDGGGKAGMSGKDVLRLLNEVLELKRKKKKFTHLLEKCNWPGTVYCKRVKLLEKIPVKPYPWI